jgi:hypothetical protein
MPLIPQKSNKNGPNAIYFPQHNVVSHLSANSYGDSISRRKWEDSPDHRCKTTWVCYARVGLSKITLQSSIAAKRWQITQAGAKPSRVFDRSTDEPDSANNDAAHQLLHRHESQDQQANRCCEQNAIVAWPSACGGRGNREPTTGAKK